jgi:deoxyadenosine/deoxycytidine kinase
MGKLIAVVGNSGVGKTALVQALSQAGGYFTALESHAERPFQELFARDLTGFALPNQVDYLLLRAEQEQQIRLRRQPGLQDGGLDLDYWVFTRFFHAQGYLDEAGFGLCTRLYQMLRSFLPPPDLLISLAAPVEVAARRMQQRSRGLEIARLGDLHALQILLDDWLENTNVPVVRVDASGDDPQYRMSLPELMRVIEEPFH